jgi:hypothetical protein
VESRGSFMYRPPRSNSAGWSPGKVICLYHEAPCRCQFGFTFLRLIRPEGRGVDSLLRPIACITSYGP